MNKHHLRYFLRQWIEHTNPANLRLHTWINGIGWLALTTLLSQIPTPVGLPILGANAGAWFVALSTLYWMPVDLLVSALVASLSLAWAALPFGPWGPGHGWITGVLLPLVVFTTTGLTALYAHIYYHEHAVFMNGDAPLAAALETAHAVIWGAHHFWLQRLLRAGYRPALGALLDAGEREALLRRESAPWSNWSGTVSCRPGLRCVPRTVQDLVDVVREAAAEGRRVRVVASGFSWSACVPTTDVLIFCERLDRISVDLDDPEGPRVWVEAGVTNRQLNAELAKHGLVMPWNVVLENVRVAGVVSVGTHGSGRETSTVGDLVEELEVVTSDGELRNLSEATVGAEVMSAARLGLGMFGVIARIKLRVTPSYRVLQIDQRLPAAETLQRMGDLVRAHESVELYWFAFNDDVWLRTFDRTERPLSFAGHGLVFLGMNFVQHLFLIGVSRFVERFARRHTPIMSRFKFAGLTFGERVLTLPDAVHYRRWIELVRCGCIEVGFKVDDDFGSFREAFQVAQRLCEAYAQRGLFPLNLTLNVRFIGPSSALLSPAYGAGLTCYIEALCVGRSRGWDEFSADLCAEWLKIPGALPHWAKEFEHVPGVYPLSQKHLGDRRRRFLDAWIESRVDPRRMFVNPLITSLLGDEAA